MINRGKPTKSGLVELTFTVPVADSPGQLSVVGDFNGWDPYAHPMRAEDGVYQVTAIVGAGEAVCFRYLADGGVWFDDPDADYHDEHGGHLLAAAPNGQAESAPGRDAAKTDVRDAAKSDVRDAAKSDVTVPARDSSRNGAKDSRSPVDA
ncbi:isoamylase early set domain-containing protein [Sphaerisporangium perillae]|uniref:isoamylase early set domain-containing protein n=1 Tax=Sphaerisporangium perillae TaxID=2935860 RepID=UPI002010547C|nr:isoamylase early set domain-containing protein [Sphaerisporangium perillae]